MTIIGPPHLGQSQRPLESLLSDMALLCLGRRAEQMKAKWQGSVARLRLARKAEVPDAHEAFRKARATKNRRRNLSTVRVSKLLFVVVSRSRANEK